MLGGYGAPADMFNNISFYAWPIHSLPHLSFHPIDALMCSMQISKGMVEELWGMQTLVPLRSRQVLMVSSFLVPQKCQAMWGMSCQCSGYPLRVRQ